MEAMFLWMLSEAWPYIVGALAVLAALFGYGRHQRKEGRKEVEQAALEAAAEQRRRVNEADTKVAQMDDDRVRRELGKWVRPTDADDR